MNKKITSLMIAGLIIAIMILSVLLYYPNAEKITGRPTVPTSVEVLPGIPQNCSFTMDKGWNLVSFFCLSTSNPTIEVLESINGSYNKIFSYASTDSIDPWKSYNPSLPSWAVQQLNYMSRMSGYWIYMTSEANYTFEGYEKYTIIPLYPGWNLVGYTSQINHKVNESLANIQFNLIRTYDTGSDTYPVYIVSATNNTLEYLEKYKGYWINSTASQNWIIHH